MLTPRHLPNYRHTSYDYCTYFDDVIVYSDSARYNDGAEFHFQSCYKTFRKALNWCCNDKILLTL